MKHTDHHHTVQPITYLYVAAIGAIESSIEYGIGYGMGNNVINFAGFFHSAGDVLLVLLAALFTAAIANRFVSKTILLYVFAVVATVIYAFGALEVYEEASVRLTSHEHTKPIIAMLIGIVSIMLNIIKGRLVHSHAHKHNAFSLGTFIHIVGDFILGVAAFSYGFVRVFLPEWDYGSRIDWDISMIAIFWLSLNALIVSFLTITGRIDKIAHTH